MRPYLAIIKDSFREALASRVLWVLLLLITLTLIALIPVGWRSSIAAKLLPTDVRNPPNLVGLLRAGQAEGASPLEGYLWESLGDETRQEIIGLENNRRAFRVLREVTGDFNKMIEQPDFFRPELWQGIDPGERLQALIDNPSRTEEQTQQLNRLAMERAMPGQLRHCPDEAMVFKYAKWDLDFGVIPPLERKWAVEILENFVLAFMGIVVGFFGIFSAILVTAPIIPNMLDSGSLYVLLSKPISRPLLFLAKFAGGCSFVLINAAYLMIGLWLILGSRFGLWWPRLLWSIPIFLFSFAIFYSVSALAGLVWRSTVMAIAATIMFWLVCWLLGVTKDSFDAFLILPQRIARAFPAGDELMIQRQNGEFARWDKNTTTWEPTFQSQEPAPRRQGPPGMTPASRLLGPVYDQGNQRLVAVEPKWPQPRILVGRQDQDWSRTGFSAGPRNARALFSLQGRPILVADQGVYALDGAEPNPEVKADGINIFGLKIPKPKPKESDGLERISVGAEQAFRGDMLAALDASNNDLYLHSLGSLYRFTYQPDGFVLQTTAKLDTEDVTDMAASSGAVCVTDRDGKVVILDGESLQPREEVEPMPNTPARQVFGSTNSPWFAVLFENDRLWLYDHAAKQATQRVSGQGSISGISIGAEGELLVGDLSDRLTAYSLPDLRREHRWAPRLSIPRRLYQYAISPLYFVFPKPKDLANTMRYALTGKETMSVETPMGGKTTVKLDPWPPLKSNLAFIAVMLLVGCFYVYRQDF